MSELILSRDQRLSLKAESHHLNPVVLLGAQGLSEAVLKEVDRALTAHQLIKVRLPGDDRDERDRIFASMAEELGAARVQMIGKVVVLFRPLPDEDKAVQGEPGPGTRKRPAKPVSARAGATGAGTASRPTRGRNEIRSGGPRTSAPRRTGRGS